MKKQCKDHPAKGIRLEQQLFIRKSHSGALIVGQERGLFFRSKI